MENEGKSSVALVGITYVPKWYKGRLKSIKHTDKIRGDLILYSTRFAAGLGHRVVLVDSGSSKTFVGELKHIPGVKLFLSKLHRRSPNRRKAIFEASKIPGVEVIVMTEIEKVSLVTDSMELIVAPVLHGDADVVIPKREDSLFKKSYPGYMYESETEGNLLYNEALRANGLLSAHMDDLDVFFGARVYRNDPKMLKFLLSRYDAHPFDSLSEHKLLNLEEYSNAQFFPVVKALTKKGKVVSVTVPFVYPEKQKENEEKGEREFFILKRRYQRLTIIIELMYFLGFLARTNKRVIRKSNSK